MKEVLIIFGIILVVIILSVITEKYVDNNMIDILNKLEELEVFALKDDKDVSMEKISQVLNKWEKIKDKLSILIDHKHMDKAELSLKVIKKKLEANENSNIMSEIQNAKFAIEDINGINKLNLKNIF